ncbi:MAG: hypothetical protein AB7O57_08015 [Hyphomicrobiaceae bacterium]
MRSSLLSLAAAVAVSAAIMPVVADAAGGRPARSREAAPAASEAGQPKDAAGTQSAPQAAGDRYSQPTSLEDCMAYWDSSSHMTRAEWRATCKRSIDAIRATAKSGNARF